MKLKGLICISAIVVSATSVAVRAEGFRPIFHPPTSSIIDALRQDKENFSTLIRLIEKSGSAELTKEGQSFTLFAPTNAAFAKLPNGAVDNLLNDKKRLTQFLRDHLFPGKVLLKEILKPVGPADKGNQIKRLLRNLNNSSAELLCNGIESNLQCNGAPSELQCNGVKGGIDCNGFIGNGSTHVTLSGTRAVVMAGDFEGKSAVIQVIDSVFLPKSAEDPRYR